MHYKLSALELELLAKDRDTILKQFQDNQTLHRKQLKPPILVVPFDTSGLLCFIRREDREDENLSDEASVSSDDSNLKLGGRILKQMQKFRKFVMNRFSTPDPVHRGARRHQKRLRSGVATSMPYPGISGAVMEATGALMASGLHPANAGSNGNLGDLGVLGEIRPLLSMKCDVCVLSEYSQVFRLIDGILESDLWPLQDDDLQEEANGITASNGHAGSEDKITTTVPQLHAVPSSASTTSKADLVRTQSSSTTVAARRRTSSRRAKRNDLPNNNVNNVAITTKSTTSGGTDSNTASNRKNTSSNSLKKSSSSKRGGPRRSTKIKCQQ